MNSVGNTVPRDTTCNKQGILPNKRSVRTTVVIVTIIAVLIGLAVFLGFANSNGEKFILMSSDSTVINSHTDVVHNVTKTPKENIVDNGDIQGNGYHTVTIFDQRFYVFDDGSIILNSIMLDKEGLLDVTSSVAPNRKAVYQEIITSGIPIVIKGSGKAEFIVFTDPDCPVCQKFEKDIHLEGVVQKTFFMPLDEAHPNSRAHIADILKTGNPALAMHDYMVNKMDLPKSSKKTTYPFEKALAYAEKAMVFGTPTIITPDGSVIPFLGNTILMKRMIEAHQ